MLLTTAVSYTLYYLTVLPSGQHTMAYRAAAVLLSPLAPSTGRDRTTQDETQHGTCLVLPGASWKEPGAHLAHVSCFDSLLYVPAAHGTAVAEPTEQEVPAGQTTHCSTEVITLSDAFLCVPPGHGSAAAAPSAQ